MEKPVVQQTTTDMEASYRHMSIWNKIAAALNPSLSDLDIAKTLLAEVKQSMPINRTQTSMLMLSDAVIASFYSMLEAEAGPQHRLAKEKSSSWMLDSSFCWVNVRGSAHGDRAGSFIQAAKLLPAISSKAILLAPFHPVEFELCYAPENMHSADPAFAEKALSDKNISLADQLRAFVTAARLLGKTAGYELLPYTAQFSRIAMEMPHLFRWVFLDESRKYLALADPAHPYSKEDRLRESKTVATLVASVKAEYKVDSFFIKEEDTKEQVALIDKAYYSAIKLCIEQGLWPVPAHARAGVGIPSFLRYDGTGDFPVFSYRDVYENDLGAEAYSVVAPFAFYDDMPVNKLPSTKLPINTEALEYYCGIFPYWRDNYGFDFMRMNAVDSLFSNVLDDNGNLPVSDRPTAELVAMVIKKARQGWSGVGVIASRKGDEYLSYASLGFDLVMGTEALRRIDEPLVTDSFKMYDALSNAGHGEEKGSALASACFAVDVPESSAPRLWGSPMAKVMGPKRMVLRHFFARFISVGQGKRPFFETMGLQDGSSGLYESGLSVRGLDWADDASFAQAYTLIEQLYNRLAAFLSEGVIVSRHVEAEYAWWIVGSGKADNADRLIVLAVSLETAEGRAPGNIFIKLDSAYYEGVVHKLPDSSYQICVKDVLNLNIDFLDVLLVELTKVPDKN